MAMIDYEELLSETNGISVERPNKKTDGTLSGHATGEPFEKAVYRILKRKYPNNVFKQYEYLNDIYLKNPKTITVEDRNALFQSPTVLFLLSRGEKATGEWSPNQLFEEKQNDTADIVYRCGDYFDIIDVKTRNVRKKAMPPNIISAYKLAKMCAYMIDNNDYDTFDIHYVEVEWEEDGEQLRCTKSYYASLFKENPEELYINWAAAMQIQFHVSELKQEFIGSKALWAQRFIKVFVKSAKARCDRMMKEYVVPFLRYLDEEERRNIMG